MMEKKPAFFVKHKVLTGLLAAALILVCAGIAVLNIRKPEPEGSVNFDLTFPETEPEGSLPEETHEMEEEDVKDYAQLEKTVFSDLGYTHYLLLGVDGDTPGYKGKRSDAGKILSVSKTRDRAVLTAIPRDTYVYIEGKGYDKLTHSYSYGQAPLIQETIEANFDIKIERYFTINFQGVRDMVDLVGGIPMTVTQAESDCMTYMFNTPGTTAGSQILSGDQALAFCRIRKIDSDLKRTERQYRVLAALFQKAKKIPVSKYPAMLGKIYDSMYTDATLGECLSLANTIMGMDLDEIENHLLISDQDAKGRMLTNLKGTKTWYYVPYDLEGIMRNFRDFLGVEGYEPSPRIVYLSNYLKDTFGTGQSH